MDVSTKTSALLQGGPHPATFKSILLFLGPLNLAKAASSFRLSYKNTQEMLEKWQTAVMLSEAATPLAVNSPDLCLRLRTIFRNVRGELLRDMYALMGHAEFEADVLNVNQLVKAVVAHVLKASLFTISDSQQTSHPLHDRGCQHMPFMASSFFGRAM